jgi:predicted nucleic acid-binding protein
VSTAYVDSSCLVAIALAEPGHEVVAARLGEFDRVVSSNLLEAEFLAALAREGVDYEQPVPGRMSWLTPDRPLSAEIRTTLAAGRLRGADLWHLSCALYLSPNPRELTFMTLDQHQAWVAASLGFPTMQMDAPAGR